MRLSSHITPHRELAEARWLHSPAAPPAAGHGGFTAQLLDAAVLTQAPARSDRARAADWALRVCRAGQLRPLGPVPRLLALALTAQAPAAAENGLGERDQLAYMCGLTTRELTHVLDLLVDAGFLQSWQFDPSTEDAVWSLATPDHPTAY
ncbi:hypothetical protein ACFRCW_34210 [Streptomyces sp. NPDC056653]